MHKKGIAENFPLVFVGLFLFVFIAGGIVASIYLFYGEGYDFREGEAELLSFKIKECILENDEIDMDNFFDLCRLDKNVLEANNLVKICENSGDCAYDEAIVKVGGNFPACRFIAENKDIPKCIEKDFDKNGKKFSVITGSKQFSRGLLG